MISPREILLAFLVPALACVLLGMLAARVREGAARRIVAALAVALPYLLAFWTITGHVPILEAPASATQLVPLLALPVALLAALAPPAAPLLGAAALGVLFFGRLGAPPGWLERVAAVLALGLAWTAARGGASERPAWRPLLGLGTFAGAVAFCCLAGRIATLALVAGGIGVCIGAAFLASLRKPAWSFGAQGFDVAVFALGGSLACAVYLGELAPWPALVLLAALALSRLPAFAAAFGAQLALTALAIWLAWPADGLGE